MTRREQEMLKSWLEAGEGVSKREHDELLDPILLRKGYLERVHKDTYALTARGASQAAVRGRESPRSQARRKRT